MFFPKNTVRWLKLAVYPYNNLEDISKQLFAGVAFEISFFIGQSFKKPPARLVDHNGF
jgi:hypothetical protein